MTDRKIVAVFGAGASRACGGLSLGEVLPKAFDREGIVDEPWHRLLTDFLSDVFGVSGPDFVQRTRQPDVGLLLSVIDMTIEQGRGLVSQSCPRPPSRGCWRPRDLVGIREILDGLIIKSVLDAYLKQFDAQKKEIEMEEIKRLYPHEVFLDYLYGLDRNFSLISMNYDLFLERAAMQHLSGLKARGSGGTQTIPIYNVSFEAPYAEPSSGRQLHKLHGSMDWLYCTGCGRVQLYQTRQWLEAHRLNSEEGPDSRPVKTLNELSDMLLDPERQAKCEWCDGDLRPMIIPPTLAKNYANSHIRRIWSHAEAALRRADSLYFVGYSLPLDDIVVITAFKQNTQHIDRKEIVLILPEDRDAEKRYKTVFGQDIEVFNGTFEEWVARQAAEIPTFREYKHYEAAKRSRDDQAA
jgi:NAD-dependent SIR2 family protein deacetylase